MNFFSAKARIRTWVALRRQFYRLLRLSTPAPWRFSEPKVGLEPTTCCLQNSYSATELLRLNLRKLYHINGFQAKNRKVDEAPLG